MKLGCVGDLHLGAGAEYGNVAYGPGSRLADQQDVWLRACEVFVAEDVDAVLFTGDAFHRRKPTPAENLAFRSGLDRLGMHGIPVFAIPGNHDVATADLPCALDLFVGELELHRTPTVRQFEGVYLCFLPWIPLAQLVAQRGGGDRDEIHRTAGDLLVDIARGLRAQCDDDGQKILISHWSVGGAQTPTGVYTDDFREPVIARADLESLGFDWVVLGHIHKHQRLDAAGRIFYCSSPCIVDFGEANVDHGVYLIDTDTAEATYVNIADRDFVTIEADLVGVDDAADVLIAYALGYPGGVEGAVVRVRYRATPDQRIDHSALRQALVEAGAHRVYSIASDIVRADRARVAGVDETLSAREAIDHWLGVQDVDELARDLVRAKAAEYLEQAGVA